MAWLLFYNAQREELSPEACGLRPDSLWSIAKLCSRLSSTPRSPLCVIPPHFCQSVAWNTNPTPGPYSSLSVLSGTETSELPSQILLSQLLGFLGGTVAKHLPARSGDAGDMGSIPGSGRSPGGGHGNPLQYSCLENPMDRGAWWATVHGVAKSQAQLSN